MQLLKDAIFSGRIINHIIDGEFDRIPVVCKASGIVFKYTRRNIFNVVHNLVTYVVSIMIF